ncbi:MAG: molecular chaperone TorD family protein [bacterium]|nr:molecular chaperone TorD family protein [bacterium]
MQTTPDPHSDTAAYQSLAKIDVPSEDVMRAALYRTLAVLLGRTPQQQELTLLTELGSEETPLGEALGTVSRHASRANPDQIEDEYSQLFIGVGRGELVPHASYYLTGFLNEKPLVRLRQDLRDLGIAKQPDLSEPEDHISTLLEIMAGLILGEYGEASTLEQQHKFFRTHLSPWASHFFKDLEAAKTANFYKPVGAVGRLFLEIEEQAFSMS